MRSNVLIGLTCLLVTGTALAAIDTPEAPKPPLHPALAGACPALPKPRSGPPPFTAGETLAYDVDVMGAKAGRMTLEVLPAAGSEIPVRVKAESNTFFDKVRKIKGVVTSYLRQRDLRPARFHEDLSEGTLTRVAQVMFGSDKVVDVSWTSNTSHGESRYAVAGEALDYAGGIFLFRGIPLNVGQPLCFEAYAVKRMWRVEGKVEAKEHVSIPAGEFDAFHLSAIATSVTGKAKREVHIWISDDARRLPLAAVGVIDLGPVRATLVQVERPDGKVRGPKATMEW